METVARHNPEGGAVHGSDDGTGCASNPWTISPRSAHASAMSPGEAMGLNSKRYRI
jgi:hypothetical protein